MKALIKESAHLAYASRAKALLSALIDIAHLFSFSAIFTFLMIPIVERLEAIAAIMREGAKDITSDSEIARGLSEFLKKQPEFMVHYRIILRYSIILILSAYLLWILFQGISWYLASKSVDKNVKFSTYMLRFLPLNIIVFAIFTLIMIVPIMISMANVFTLFSLVSDAVARLLFVLLILLLAYFTFIAYALIAANGFAAALKKTFVIGIKRFKDILLTYLIAIIALIILFALISLFRNSLAITLLIILLSLPVFFWLRVLVALTLRKLTETRA